MSVFVHDMGDELIIKYITKYTESLFLLKKSGKFISPTKDQCEIYVSKRNFVITLTGLIIYKKGVHFAYNGRNFYLKIDDNVIMGYEQFPRLSPQPKLFFP